MDEHEKVRRDAAVDEMLARRRSEPSHLPSLGYTSPAFAEPVTQASYNNARDAWVERHVEWLKSDAVECFNPFPIPGDETVQQMTFRMVMGEIVHRVLLSKLYPDEAWLLGRVAPWQLAMLAPSEKALLADITASRERERSYGSAGFAIDLELRPQRERELHGEREQRDPEKRARDEAVDRMLARQARQRGNDFGRER